jgi:hypothetical protein
MYTTAASASVPGTGLRLQIHIEVDVIASVRYFGEIDNRIIGSSDYAADFRHGFANRDFQQLCYLRIGF